MPIVCGIKFRGAGKAYFFDPGEIGDLQKNDLVIVETSRGVEMGHVALPPHEVAPSDIVGDLKPILRCATTTDRLDAQHFQAQEDEAVVTCREQVDRVGLPMKVVKAEYSYDGSRLTFFFTAEQRVDFRQLVRELARIFKTRIELRQVGVRDEAKMVGGIGKCGRPLCCATWLTEFSPVSIRMAKQQDLPLSPMEISGQCGRLLCCLTYEHEYYRKIKSKFPKVGKVIETPLGEARVIKICVLRETVSLLLSDDSTAELTIEQLHGEEPIELPDGGRGMSKAQRHALGRALGSIDAVEEPDTEASASEQQQIEERTRGRSRRSRSGRQRSRSSSDIDDPAAARESGQDRGQKAAEGPSKRGPGRSSSGRPRGSAQKPAEQGGSGQDRSTRRTRRSRPRPAKNADPSA